MNHFSSLPFAVSLSVYNERLAVVLGFMTLLSVLTVFLSCRTCVKMLNKIGLKRMVSHKSYQTFLKYHTYYWWLFWLIFVLHLMAAIMHLGFNTAGDQDAFLHKYSTIFGVSALLTVIVVSVSCRGIATLVRLFSERKFTDFKLISVVYKYHTYYWTIFFLLTASHFTAGYLHSGWWPTGI
jgi:hypothetical protein